MAAGPEIKEFKSRVDATYTDLQTLRVKLDEFAQYTKTAAQVVKAVDDTGDAADEITKVIDDQLSLLKLTKLAGPLKGPSKAYEKVLQAVRPVSDKIDKAVDKLNGKTDKNDDGKILDNIETVLKTSSEKLTDVSGIIRTQEDKLGDLSDTMGAYIKALDVAGDFGGTFDSIRNRVETQLGARNEVAQDIDDLYASLVSKIKGIVDIMDDAQLDLALAGGVDLGGVQAFFDIIATPLNAAAVALEPVEGILDTVGFLVDIVLGPIFSFLTATLGIDALLESIGEDIKDKFPNPTFLDDFTDELQAMIDDLRDFISPEGFGVNALIDKIEEGMFGDNLGNHVTGAMGWGTNGNDFIAGHSGADILDGRAGDDSIRGSNGNDIFVASEGDDVLDGGNGTDLLNFDGFFSEYELSKNEATGQIIVTHVNPPEGGKNEGSETFINIEHIVFRNITFTGEELANSIIGASVLEGTSNDDLIFLNSTANTDNDPTTNTVGGYHVVEAGAGNDRIFGSTQSDRLEGEAGDDVFIPGDGADIVNGGSGSDTYQVLAEASSRNINGFLDQGQVQLQGGENDTVSSVENLIIQIKGDHDLYGTDSDSFIISATGDDVISGRGGDDFIEAGEGNDYIIGGAGKDSIFGGKGNDYIAVGAASVAGQSEYYDGGEGRDELAYSNSRPSIPNQALNTRVKAAFDEIANIASPGRVRIIAGEGKVEHLAQNGSVIATDTVVDIETLIGSEYDDVLYGVEELGDLPTYLNGSGGDDILYANASTGAYGGAGDDLVIMSDLHLELGLQNIAYSGGGDAGDVFDMSVLNDTRLYFQATSPDGSGQLRAYDASQTGKLQTTGSLITANVGGFGLMEFGNKDDRLLFNPISTGVGGTFRLGKGDDDIQVSSGFATIEGGDGADTIRFDGSARGAFFGGNGNDSGTWDTTKDDLVIEGGSGQDQFTLLRFKGDIDGGAGFDTVSVNGNSVRRINVSMTDGLIRTRSQATNQLDEHVVANISNIEQVVGTVFGDYFDGNVFTDAAEQFVGREGNDSMRGFDGNDTFYGGDGTDTIQAGEGNDLLHGGAGTDTLDGGAGSDTISYAHAVPDELDGSLRASNFGGVSVNLATGQVFGSHGNDTIFSIENVFGSNSDDSLTGDSGDNILTGAGGDDDLHGAAGDDYLVTGRGTDTASGGSGKDTIVVDAGTKVIDGGSNTDTLDFGTVSGTVYIDFASDRYTAEFVETRPVWVDNGGTEARQNASQTLTPQLVREIDPFFSNSIDDLTRQVIGNSTVLTDPFRIRDINELVTSTGTWDSVEEFTGGVAGTVLTLSTGVDRFDGARSGQDFIDLAAHGSAINYNFATGATNTQLLAGDDFVDVEGIYASAFGDSITGHSGVNILYGYSGNDRLNGAGGNDDVYDGKGNDTVNLGSGNDYVRVGGGRDSYAGGSGKDYISYFDSSGGITIDLAEDEVTGSWANNDTIDSFESVSGSNVGGDTVYGTSGDNTVRTYGGDDRVYAEGGSDKVYLGNGDDYVRVGGGNESFFGGSGTDYISYYDSTNGVNIDLATNEVSGSWAVNDRISSFEGVSGSETGDDEIRGTSGANTIRTYGGDDRVYAEGGSDKVYLGNGDDYVRVGGGNESFFGGSGTDYISYYDSTNGVNIDLATNEVSGSWAVNDRISSFEGVSGSETGDDEIRGTSGANTVRTYGGDDRVYAEGGSDKVYLGSGDDYVRVGGGNESFFGGSGTDYISYYDSANGVNIDLATNEVSGSWAVNDTISSFEGVSGSETGDDEIRGTSGANTIRTYGGDDRVYAEGGSDKVYLGSGDDYVRVGGGNESFFGGSGTDYISYYDSANGIRIDLRDDEVSGSWAVNDTIKDFESASGSGTGDDVMLGTSGANTFRGFGGDDKLYGRSGSDKLYGGSGEDYFDGGAGRDLLYGGSGRDVFHFDRGEDNDVIKDFENNIDTIELDNFVFGSGQDAFDFATQSGADVIFDFGNGDILTVEDVTIIQLQNDLDVV